MTRDELILRTRQLIAEGERLDASPSLNALQTWLQLSDDLLATAWGMMDRYHLAWLMVGKPKGIVRGREMTADEAAAYVREVASAKTAALRMSLDAVERQRMPFRGESGGIGAGQGMGTVPSSSAGAPEAADTDADRPTPAKPTPAKPRRRCRSRSRRTIRHPSARAQPESPDPARPRALRPPRRGPPRRRRARRPRAERPDHAGPAPRAAPRSAPALAAAEMPWPDWLRRLLGGDPSSTVLPPRHDRREAARDRHAAGGPAWSNEDRNENPDGAREVEDIAPGTIGAGGRRRIGGR